MEATILPNGNVFEVWVDGEVKFTHADRMECAFWANSEGYNLAN